MLPYPVPMRAAPTYTGSATAARFYNNSQSADFNLSSLSFANMDTNSVASSNMSLKVSAQASGGRRHQRLDTNNDKIEDIIDQND